MTTDISNVPYKAKLLKHILNVLTTKKQQIYKMVDMLISLIYSFYNEYMYNTTYTP